VSFPGRWDSARLRKPQHRVPCPRGMSRAVRQAVSSKQKQLSRLKLVLGHHSSQSNRAPLLETGSRRNQPQRATAFQDPRRSNSRPNGTSHSGHRIDAPAAPSGRNTVAQGIALGSWANTTIWGSRGRADESPERATEPFFGQRCNIPFAPATRRRTAHLGARGEYTPQRIAPAIECVACCNVLGRPFRAWLGVVNKMLVVCGGRFPRPLAWATLDCPFGANNAESRRIGRRMKMKRCGPAGAG